MCACVCEYVFCVHHSLSIYCHLPTGIKSNAAVLILKSNGKVSIPWEFQYEMGFWLGDTPRILPGAKPIKYLGMSSKRNEDGSLGAATNLILLIGASMIKAKTC